jgi:hypothetical protein
MEWTLAAGAATATLSWEAGHLDGDPALVDLVLERAAEGGTVAPVFGSSVPVGLALPLEAWATITATLSDQFGHRGEVQVPPPPVEFADAPPGAVI